MWRQNSARIAALAATAALTLLGACSAGGSTDQTSTRQSAVPSGPTTSAPPSAANPGDSADPSADTTTSPTAQSAPTATPVPDGDPTEIESLSLSEVAELVQPISIAWHPDGAGPFVAGKLGTIHRIGADPPELLLDMTDLVSTNSERGLLSIAFAPDGRHMYAHWSDVAGDSVLSAWRWGPDTAQAGLAPADRVDILTIEQPFSNHNGGGLAFGPDGYLYWGQGDGGSAGDPLGSGQDRSTLLGAILRIDPEPDAGSYSIPDDNPFVGDDASAGEIWLTGLRNPWRISFDHTTSALWIGDVGQNRFEEIDRVTPADAGADLGWNCFEGDAEFTGCTDRTRLDPVVTYGRDLGQSVTGGVVYRGAAITELHGSYVFGDFGSGRLWALPGDSRAAVELPININGVVTINRDPDGEIWIASLTSGRVGRLESP